MADEEQTPKDLRDLVDKLNRELAEERKLREESTAKLAERDKADRVRGVETMLAAKGGKASWAKYVEIDGEVNEATVQSWLESTGKEDFGWNPEAAPAATQQTEQTSPEVQAAQRISQTVATSTDVSPEGAMTPDRIHAMSDADLARLGWGADSGGRRPHRRPPPQQYR